MKKLVCLLLALLLAALVLTGCSSKKEEEPVVTATPTAAPTPTPTPTPTPLPTFTPVPTLSGTPAADYEAACALLHSYDYAGAARAFAALGNYSDATRMAMYAGALADGENGEYERAVSNLRKLGDFRDAPLQLDYYTARYYESRGSFGSAAEIYEQISAFRDSANRLANSELLQAQHVEQAKATMYAEAVSMVEAGNLLGAAEYFSELAEENYLDSAERLVNLQTLFEDQSNATAYDTAVTAEQNGDFAAALEGFTALGEYRDSAARAAALQQKGSYARAQQAIADNDLALAYECFVACGDYQDSAAKASVLSITAIAETTVINENLAAYSFNGMCGLIHLNNNTITNPAWEDIGRINEHGLIPVYNDGLYGFINAQGAEVFPCQFTAISEFNGDLCTVAVRSNDRTLYGVYNKQGQAIIPAEYLAIGSSYSYYGIAAPEFVDGLIPVMNTEGLCGFINEQGQIVGEICWSQLEYFTNGYAPVENAEGLCGFINMQGQPVGDICWAEVGSFVNGFASVRNAEGLYGFINEQGQLIGEVCWANVAPLENGRVLVKNTEGLFGYMNEQGQVLGEVCWAGIGEFVDGYAVVEGANGRYGMISETGATLIPAEYDEVTPFSDGMAAVRSGSYWGYVDQSGAKVISANYLAAEPFEAGMAEVYLENVGRQIIDKTGAIVYFVTPDMPVRYDEAISLMAAGSYADAYRIFATLAGYRDASAKAQECLEPAYTAASALFTEGSYAQAAEVFAALGSYRDAAEQLALCNAQLDHFSVTSTGSYGFELNENGYYESTNQGRHSTTAECVVTVKSSSGKVYLDVINYAESGYDYGTIYSLDSTSSKLVEMSSSSRNTSSVQTYEIDLPDANEHTIRFTFRKDSSTNRNNDSLQFKVRFGEQSTTASASTAFVMPETTASSRHFGADSAFAPACSYTVESDGRYGFVLNSDGYYESTNKGQHSTTAACYLRVSGATRVYLDVINYAESGYDYGVIYEPDSTSYTLKSLSSSSQNTSSVQTITVNLPDTEEHFIYITFRKDGSSNNYNDSLQFKVRFE